jgi:hypothetical protein
MLVVGSIAPLRWGVNFGRRIMVIPMHRRAKVPEDSYRAIKGAEPHTGLRLSGCYT